MKRLRAFAYHEPDTLRSAIEALAAECGGAQLLAGGTDLIVDMKTERIRPSAVVNLKRVPGLTGIDTVDGGTRIGALTKVTAIEQSQLVQDRYPGLAQAASILASPPIRALATIGGNVGRASPASDLGPALIVHDAVATIEGRDGVREDLVEAIYAGPGTTTLASSDVITSFYLPQQPLGFGSAHVKLGKRGSGTDIALAGISASVLLGERAEIVACRIALASLAPTPLRALAAEALLRGEAPTEAIFAAAGESVGREAKPIGDMRASASYRTTLAEVLVRRALHGAAAAAGARVAG